jgi:hypothetical protein
MPLHDYIKKIYLECDDPLYFNRFIDYVIKKRHFVSQLFIKDHKYHVTILVTGVLEYPKNHSTFHRLNDYYNNITNSNYLPSDLSIFKNIYITSSYTLNRLLCSLDEKTILEFFDINYRTYLLYNDLIRRIHLFTSLSPPDKIKIEYDNYIYYIDKHNISSEKQTLDNFKLSNFLDETENGFIKDLYYCVNNDKYLIKNE